MVERKFTERGKAFVVKHYGKLTDFFTPRRAARDEQAEQRQAAERVNDEFSGSD